MKNLTEHIESYLDGTLSGQERQEFEHRMSTDALFRKEVELHLEMESHFQDEEWHQLDSTLKDIMNNVPISKEKVNGKPKPTTAWVTIGALLILLVLLVGFLILNRPPTPVKPDTLPPANEKSIKPPSQNPKEPSMPNTETPIVKPEKKSGRQEPIAEIDPVDFEENPSFEAMIKGGFRGEKITVKMNFPKNNYEFSLSKGDEKIKFSGVVENWEDPKGTLQLLVFNNKNINNPIVEVPIKIDGKKKENQKISLSIKPPKKIGLYYYTFEMGSGEILHVGKFKTLP